MTLPDAQNGGSTPQPNLDEMQKLLVHAERFASVVRAELSELSSSRDEFLAAVERDAEDRRQRAASQAEQILVSAKRRAQDIIEDALVTAADTTATARADHTYLLEVNAQYREVFAEALSAVAGLPKVSDGTPEVAVEVVPPDPPPMAPDAAHRFRIATDRSK